MLNVVWFAICFLIGYIYGKYDEKILGSKNEDKKQDKIRNNIEECCYNEKISNGAISYETKVKISLVDMNAPSSIIIDVENEKHDSVLKFFEINKFDASRCAEFIVSSYKK